jgi:hypothetical protein
LKKRRVNQKKKDDSKRDVGERRKKKRGRIDRKLKDDRIGEVE